MWLGRVFVCFLSQWMEAPSSSATFAASAHAFPKHAHVLSKFFFPGCLSGISPLHFGCTQVLLENEQMNGITDRGTREGVAQAFPPKFASPLPFRGGICWLSLQPRVEREGKARARFPGYPANFGRLDSRDFEYQVSGTAKCDF